MPKRKKQNPRSVFLSKFMGQLSGDQGDEIISAFANQDKPRFETAMGKAIKNIMDKFETTNVNSTEQRAVASSSVDRRPLEAQLHEQSRLFGVSVCCVLGKGVKRITLKGDVGAIRSLCSSVGIKPTRSLSIADSQLLAELGKIRGYTVNASDVRNIAYRVKGQNLMLSGPRPSDADAQIDLASISVPAGELLRYLDSNGAQHIHPVKQKRDPGIPTYD